MREFDFLIVGFGIAGISITYQLESAGFNVAVIDGNEVKASEVAAGLYNPVILKRFTLAWGAEEQLKYAKDFYANLEAYLEIPTTQNVSVYRKFNNAQEQNKWVSKSENPALGKYLSTDLYPSPTSSILTPFHCGKVNCTGKVLVSQIIERYQSLLLSKNAFFKGEFHFDLLHNKEDCFIYNDSKFKNIVFCEGYKLKSNPFFNYLPLIGNKGAYLIIESEQLKLDVALKSFYFLIPLGNHRYKFGATYEHRFNNNHDVLAKKELIAKLEELIAVPYKVISFITGVRPTVVDRKPLLGEHPSLINMYVMNGMGTRGVLLAPVASKLLKDHILNKLPIPTDLDIKRFNSLYC